MDLVASLVNRKWNSLPRDAAFELRNSRNNQKPRNAPPYIISHPPTISHRFRDQHFAMECLIFDILSNFLKDVLYGPTVSFPIELRNRLIKSIASDIVFSSTNGHVRPPKLLMLGCATKPITESKKMVNILNNLSHSVSYSTIEEIETELSYSSHESMSMVPHTIKKTKRFVYKGCRW